ncbi:hypothetical protein L218DRAFT_1000891 [Marasmius fiardii PR-910]|nr:hypothetical protein L218DRAFT_1000891 [Marasmius fiardii PR-910]
MANPRQRRKTRSSSHRPVSHSKHAKRNLKKMPPIRAPKLLQDAWDKKKTVRQNYAALGLVHDLNPSAAGGAEIFDVDVNQNDQTVSTSATDLTDPPTSRVNVPEDNGASGTVNSSPLPQLSTIPKGYGRIVRDEAGNVVRIDFPVEPSGALDDKWCEDMETSMDQREPELDALTREKWVEGMGNQTGRVLVVAKNHLVEGESVVCS